MPTLPGYRLQRGHMLGFLGHSRSPAKPDGTAVLVPADCALACDVLSACVGFTWFQSFDDAQGARVSFDEFKSSELAYPYDSVFTFLRPESAGTNACFLLSGAEDRVYPSSGDPGIFTYSRLTHDSTGYTTDNEHVASEVKWRRMDVMGEDNDVVQATVPIRAEWGTACKLIDGCVRANKDVFSVSRDADPLLYNNPDISGLGGGEAPDFSTVTPVSALVQLDNDEAVRRFNDAAVAAADIGAHGLRSLTEVVISATGAGSRNLVHMPRPDNTVRPIGDAEHAAPEARAVSVFNEHSSGLVAFANEGGYRNRMYRFPKAPGAPEIIRVLGYDPPSPPSPPPLPPPLPLPPPSPTPPSPPPPPPPYPNE